MNISTIAGSIIWKDRRSGMLAQLFVMPFTRIHYLLGNLLTLLMMGFASVIIIVVCSIPIIIDETRFSLTSIPYMIFAITTGSIFFGSITSILSVKLKTSEGFDTMINGIFLFFSFASSAFYPPEEVPEVLRIIFYINPLTYVVDIIRDSMFSQFDAMTGFGVLFMSVITALSIVVATHFVLKMKDKQISTQV
jgi:ABC-2 type transport system permease protein